MFNMIKLKVLKYLQSKDNNSQNNDNNACWTAYSNKYLNLIIQFTENLKPL